MNEKNTKDLELEYIIPLDVMADLVIIVVKCGPLHRVLLQTQVFPKQWSLNPIPHARIVAGMPGIISVVIQASYMPPHSWGW